MLTFQEAHHRGLQGHLTQALTCSYQPVTPTTDLQCNKRSSYYYIQWVRNWASLVKLWSTLTDLLLAAGPFLLLRGRVVILLVLRGRMSVGWKRRGRSGLESSSRGQAYPAQHGTCPQGPEGPEPDLRSKHAHSFIRTTRAGLKDTALHIQPRRHEYLDWSNSQHNTWLVRTKYPRKGSLHFGEGVLKFSLRQTCELENTHIQTYKTP